MPIRVLDASVVGRIAAGEVVERPSSVVKELVENSLDAGATAITVEIKEGGIKYLRVTDNGCGIEPWQARLAFENHATSKIVEADELNDIRTFGFRGEALPSIAAVSKVELTTRAQGQDIGMKVMVEGGKITKVQETGCPQGTTFVMKELFFNTPVRQAFLKKPTYEGSLVTDMMAKLICGNPNVSMRYISNGRTVYHSFGDGSLQHAVFAVYGRETAQKMLEVDAMQGGMRVKGLIGVGELAKSSRAHQMFFINGRSVRCPLLVKALEQVCKGRVTIGTYPMCALSITLPASSVDVNVHPSKLEVRFRDEMMVFSAMENMLLSAFSGEKVLDIRRDEEPAQMKKPVVEIKTIQLPGDAAQPKAEEKTPVREETHIPAPAEKSFASATASAIHAMGIPQLPEKKTRAVPEKNRAAAEKAAPGVQAQDISFLISQERKRLHLGDSASRVAEGGFVPPVKPAAQEKAGADEKMQAEKDKAVSAETPKPEKPEKPEQTRIQALDDKANPDAAPVFRVIGVAFKTYILVETEKALLLIDQHAAHERLMYEKLRAQMETGTAAQHLITPMIVRLSAREMAIVQDNLDVLCAAGYEVEPFGEFDIQVRSVPFVLGSAQNKPLFMETIDALEKLRSATLDDRRGEIMIRACKSAVKAGDALTQTEIAALVREMLSTGAPPTCPHGRPVVKTMTKTELEHMFKRIQ